MRVIAEAAGAVRLALATIAARPGLILLFVLAQTASNLLRFWLGRVDDGATGDRLIAAVGWLFLVGRNFLTQWLHVAAARLTDDARASARAAFAIAGRQALWFHGMIVVSMATFAIRLRLNPAIGGFFAPGGPADASEIAPLLLGLVITYGAFLPLVPGYFTTLLKDGPAASPRWSIAAALPHLPVALGAALTVAAVPALLRRLLLSLLGDHSLAVAAATALLDAVLTVVLMMLATGVYYRLYRRVAG